MNLAFYKVAMRPGKPLMAGTLGKIPFLGLPGNPVSAMVCGIIFVLPAIRAMLGLDPHPKLHQRRVAHDLAANGPREQYMRARFTETGDVEIFDRQDSSLLSVLQAADTLVVRPPRAPALPVGSTVDVLPLD